MNRLNLLLIFFLIFFISCQSESPPKKQIEPEPIQTELAFTKLKATPTGNWVSNAILEQPMTGMQINAEPGGENLLLDASKADSKVYTSAFQHGDMELSFEYMLSKGAAASVVFQGLHALSISDSWNQQELNAQSLGSIGENLPSIQTALAPGLWQEVRVLYHAADKTKDQGAIFDKVWINGMLVQEDLEMEMSEASPNASLSLQVSNGFIAFRNIQYKLYGDEPPYLDSLNFEYYKLPSKSTAEDFIPDFSQLEAEASGQTDSLTKNVTEEKKDFGLVFTGKFNAPVEGDYLFEAHVQGGAILLIDGKEVVNHDGETNYGEGSGFGSVKLSKGTHDFTYLYRKEHMQWRQGLGLWVEGPGIEKMPLHTEGSVNPPRKHKPYELVAEEGGSLHRSYLMHQGKKLTHAISVGNTNGLHYSYDLDNASLLQMWGGKFMDVRQMWVGRGAEQLAVPMGASIVHAGNPNFAILEKKNMEWPKVLAENGRIKYKGYDINATGEPVFRYAVGTGELTDHITSNPASRSLKRTLKLEGSDESQAHILLAKGKNIHQDKGGFFGVDVFNYYLKVDEASAEPFIRDTPSGQELLLPISPNSSISYTLTW